MNHGRQQGWHSWYSMYFINCDFSRHSKSCSQFMLSLLSTFLHMMRIILKMIFYPWISPYLVIASGGSLVWWSITLCFLFSHKKSFSIWFFNRFIRNKLFSILVTVGTCLILHLMLCASRLKWPSDDTVFPLIFAIHFISLFRCFCVKPWI